jgi:hypothetical protein
MFKWITKQKNMIKRTAGIEEKAASTRRKIEVAMSILNERRKRNIEVPIDRRNLKLA